MDIFYRDANPADSGDKPPILLLHGMRFKSQTWHELGTIQFAASLGHRVIAIDLPGTK